MAVISPKIVCYLQFQCLFLWDIFFLVFVSFYLLDIIPLGLGLLWRVVELQVSDNLAIFFLDHKQELSRTSNLNMKRAQIQLTATRRATTPEWIKPTTFRATIIYQNTYTPKFILNSFPQGYFSGSGLMSHDWPLTLLVSALQPHAAFTCTLCPKMSSRRATGRRRDQITDREDWTMINSWRTPHSPPPQVRALTLGLGIGLGPLARQTRTYVLLGQHLEKKWRCIFRKSARTQFKLRVHTSLNARLSLVDEN